jgi:hypothetical protein
LSGEHVLSSPGFFERPMPEMSATTACLIVAGSSLAIYVVIALWVI